MLEVGPGSPQEWALLRIILGWQRGVVVSGVRRMKKLTHVGPG